LAQQVGAEEGAPGAEHDHWIWAMDIGPFDRQRAKPPRGVEIRHPVPTPVVTHGKDFEGLALQRMEGVRDGENLYSTITTGCIARFLPKAKWNPE
jgi:hypothetical protein